MYTGCFMKDDTKELQVDELLNGAPRENPKILGNVANIGKQNWQRLRRHHLILRTCFRSYLYHNLNLHWKSSQSPHGWISSFVKLSMRPTEVVFFINKSLSPDSKEGISRSIRGLSYKFEFRLISSWLFGSLI